MSALPARAVTAKLTELIHAAGLSTIDDEFNRAFQVELFYREKIIVVGIIDRSPLFTETPELALRLYGYIKRVNSWPMVTESKTVDYDDTVLPEALLDILDDIIVEMVEIEQSVKEV